jgi:hypothetical protein
MVLFGLMFLTLAGRDKTTPQQIAQQVKQKPHILQKRFPQGMNTPKSVDQCIEK